MPQVFCRSSTICSGEILEFVLSIIPTVGAYKKHSQGNRRCLHASNWKTLDWGEKSGENCIKEIFFGAKILAMIRHIYFQSCGAHFCIQRSTSSVPPKRSNLTTFYNILQHFTTFYNIHTTFTTFYNILQHYPWRCVVSPEGR
jgi:hypothetical protein